MKQPRALSKQTRSNWLIDAALFISAMTASITGVYFLFLPVGGYQGGRNPAYEIHILFERATWDLLHTWLGVGMIVAAVLHFLIHWDWVIGSIRRSTKEILGIGARTNWRSRFNVLIDALVGIAFLITAVSGIYFLYFPGMRGGADGAAFIFSRTAWDMLHTWGGIVMILAGLFHFAIHWGWVTKVTKRLFTAKVRKSTRQADSPTATI